MEADSAGSNGPATPAAKFDRSRTTWDQAHYSTAEPQIEPLLLEELREFIETRSHFRGDYAIFQRCAAHLLLHKLHGGLPYNMLTEFQQILDVRIDFFSRLPTELSLLVLSFLSPKDICRVAAVNRLCLELAEDPLLWRALLRNPSERIPSATPANHTPPNGNATTRSHPFKSLYKRKLLVERNWRHGTHTPVNIRWEIEKDMAIECFRFRGNTLVCGFRNNFVRFFDMQTGVCTRQLFGHTGYVNCVQFNEDKQILVSASDDETIRVWTWKDRDRQEETTDLDAHSHEIQISSNAMANGHSTADHDTTISPLPSPNIQGSPGGNASQPNGYQKYKSGECIFTLTEHFGAVYFIQLDARATTVVSGADDALVKVWSLSNGKCLDTLEGHTDAVLCLEFNEEGRLATGSEDRTLRLWDLRTATCINTLHAGGSVWSLQLAGNLLVTSQENRTIKLWDITSGKCVRTLYGHNGNVCCLQFDDNKIVSGAVDRTIKVWELRTGLCLYNFCELPKTVYCLQFDESRLAVLAGGLQLWDFSPV